MFSLSLYAIKDCANLSLFDLATDKPFLYTDYANVSTNEWSAERTYATAKGTNAIAWDSNKQSTLLVETEIFDLKWLALLAGTELKKESKGIARREVLQANTNVLTIAGTPIANSVQVVKVSEQDLIEHDGEALEHVATAVGVTAGQCHVAGNVITLASTVQDGESYAVYYLVETADVKVLTISADKFPKAYRVIADAIMREKETGKDEFVQIEYFNARPKSDFTITMSASEPTALSVTFDLFPNKDKAMAEYRVMAE